MKPSTVRLGITALAALGMWLVLSRSMVGSAPMAPAEVKAQGFGENQQANPAPVLALRASTVVSSSPALHIKSQVGVDDWGEVVIAWEGVAQSAWLEAPRICNISQGSNHPVYVNGHLIGRMPNRKVDTCECFESGGGLAITIPISDASWIQPGRNVISCSVSDFPSDGTIKLIDARLCLSGEITGVTRSYFQLSETPSLGAAVQLPVGYDPDVPTPLLICVPDTSYSVPPQNDCFEYEGEDSGLNRWAVQAAQHHWLAVSFDPRTCTPGATPKAYQSPTLDIQHDVMRLVNYMQQHYNVDRARIYIAGFSGGGGIAATIAAKYPDVFAAAVVYASPTDYAQWFQETDKSKGVRWDCDMHTSEFDWSRRSSRTLARNLRYVPMRIVHGSMDTGWLPTGGVPPSHAQGLYQAMARYYDPVATSKEFITPTVGHVYPVTGVSESDLDFLSRFTVAVAPRELQIIADEGKEYYWLRLAKAGRADTAWAGFAEVDARFDPAENTVWINRVRDGENLTLTLTLDLSRMGLDARTTYEVEDYDPRTGDFELSSAWPQDGKLSVAVRRNRFGVVERQLIIHPARGGPVQTLRLQQGLEGYAGARDTYIVSPGALSADQDVPHGSAPTLPLRYDVLRKAFLQFDLSAVQAIVNEGGEVKSAKLVMDLTEGRSSSLPVLAKEVLRGWTDNEARWDWAQNGQRWNAAGASSSLDIRSTAEYTVEVKAAGSYTFNLKPLVLRWLANSSSNFGLALIGQGTSNTSKYPLASAEHADVNKRPALEIQYMEAAATPTPTGTASPTVTVTPTASATVTLTASPTATASPEATPTATISVTPSRAASGTPTASLTATASATVTPTRTAKPTRSWRIYLPLIIVRESGG